MRPKIKSYHKGRASNEGNGMVGGRWWGCKRLGYADVDYLPAFESIINDSHYADVTDWFRERLGDTVRVEAYFDCGKDESVGLSEYCDMDEWFYPDDFENAVCDCPFLSDAEQERVMEDFGKLAEDEDGYELYEIDYPEE